MTTTDGDHGVLSLSVALGTDDVLELFCFSSG